MSTNTTKPSSLAAAAAALKNKAMEVEPTAGVDLGNSVKAYVLTKQIVPNPNFGPLNGAMGGNGAAVQAPSTPSPAAQLGTLTRGNLTKLMNEIKTERMKQGLTQRQLASMASMSQGSVTRIERHGYMSVWALLKITNALGKEIILN